MARIATSTGANLLLQLANGRVPHLLINISSRDDVAARILKLHADVDCQRGMIVVPFDHVCVPYRGLNQNARKLPKQ